MRFSCKNGGSRTLCARQVVEATKHMDVVFHCATAAPTGANALNNNLMYSVNVDGTRNIIEACVANGVPKLVCVRAHV